MHLSPLRPSFVDPTPVKKVVECDINGWMETHLKRKQTPIRRKIQFRKDCKKDIDQGKSIPALNTLDALKRQRMNLLQQTWTNTLKRKSLPSTVASRDKSSASPPISNCNKMNNQKKSSRDLNLIEVSQFNPFDRQDKKKEKYLLKRGPSSLKPQKNRQRLSDILGLNVTTNNYKPMKVFRCRVAKMQQNN